MVIYGVYIVSKSGGLIFNYECNVPKIETEKTFGYPLDLKLNYENKKIVVEFGQRDGVMVGHVLTAVNGIPATGRQLDDGRDVFDIINERENYPLSLKFARLRMTTNEKIFLASMFYPLFAIASQLSPEPRCSGIEVLEADTFKLQCFQTLTGIFCALLNTDLTSDKLSLLYSCFGVKFMVVAEPTQAGLDILLRRIYELYSDFALKNPFYSLEMPIRCELFDSNLQNLLEHVEKTGISNVRLTSTPRSVSPPLLGPSHLHSKVRLTSTPRSVSPPLQGPSHLHSKVRLTSTPRSVSPPLQGPSHLHSKVRLTSTPRSVSPPLLVARSSLAAP
uniref:Trafficking protein particle complex subunit 4 n=1 Tax=Timema bartmani TaxID=61472 RepID=A0A7R9I419_9NEOP|nr:unnamed protein product [Timema bartmani]